MTVTLAVTEHKKLCKWNSISVLLPFNFTPYHKSAEVIYEIIKIKRRNSWSIRIIFKTNFKVFITYSCGKIICTCIKDVTDRNMIFFFIIGL